MVGMPFHMSAMMLTMAPPWRCASPSLSIHCVTHSRAIRKPPVRLLRTTASQPLAVIALQRRRELAAGVVDQRVDAAVAREHRGDGGLDLRFLADVAGMRRADAAGGLDLALHRVAACASVRPTITTAAPSAASSCAVQRPMPEPPPVTTTTWPGTGPARRSIGSATRWKSSTDNRTSFALAIAPFPARSLHAARHDLRRRPHAARQGQERRQPARGQADRPARRAARQAAAAPRLRPGGARRRRHGRASRRSASRAR